VAPVGREAGLYEALSAGAATGLLPVPRRRSSRPSRGVDALLASRQVMAFGRWAEGAALPRLAVSLNEAERSARRPPRMLARDRRPMSTRANRDLPGKCKDQRGMAARRPVARPGGEKR
jgi:hypothetical protein